METNTETTRVVFRQWPDGGDVLALFPDETEHGGLCSSYQHLGQHGAADYLGCIGQTLPAPWDGIRTLAAELEAIGYRLALAVHCDECGRATDGDTD